MLFCSFLYKKKSGNVEGGGRGEGGGRVGGQKQPTHEWMPRKRLRQRLLWLVGTGGGGYIKAAKHRQQEMQAWHRER
jgi:hypothetical protein